MPSVYIYNSICLEGRCQRSGCEEKGTIVESIIELDQTSGDANSAVFLFCFPHSITFRQNMQNSAFRENIVETFVRNKQAPGSH